MAQFRTTIPLRLKGLLRRLPRGAQIQRLGLNPERTHIILEWEHEPWRTPYTVPVEISPAALRRQEPLPECVQGAVH